MKKILTLLFILFSIVNVYAADVSGVRDIQSFEIQGIIPKKTTSGNPQYFYLYVMNLYENSQFSISQDDVINMGYYTQDLSNDFTKLFQVVLVTNSYVVESVDVEIKPFAKVSLNDNGELGERDYTKTLQTLVKSSCGIKYSEEIPDYFAYSSRLDSKHPTRGDTVNSPSEIWYGGYFKYDFGNSGKNRSSNPDPTLWDGSIDYTEAKQESPVNDEFTFEGIEYIHNGSWNAQTEDGNTTWKYSGGYFEKRSNQTTDTGLLLLTFDYSVKIGTNPSVPEEGMYVMDVTVTLNGV